MLFTLFLAAGWLTPASAHRGASDDTDPCRIQVGPEWIHFAAYTPTSSGNKSYCKAIPDVGMTNLVFDYEGKKLRKVSIEFEVTKEPEGTRVFYRPPDTTKSGTVDGAVDFSQFGPGNYQVHVTIVDKEKKLDTHIPFSVGVGGDESYIGIKKFLLTFLVCAVIAYLSFKLSRGKDDDPKTGNIADRS
ncbi:MAG: hypothetical protein ACU841_04040 [Gammaproteobacteria bacterium]